MKKIIITIMCVFGIANAYAENENAATSKEYVDTAIATKQPTIPAEGNNVVITFDSSADDGIGTKPIYDESASYASQQDALVTAATANAAVQMAINGEFYCKEYSTIVENDCWLWGIKPHTTGKNLFNKDDSSLQFNGYLAYGGGERFVLTKTNSGNRTLLIKATPNTTYTVQRRTDLGSCYNRMRICAFTDTPSDGIQCPILNLIDNTTTRTATFTTPADTKYIGIYIRNCNSQPETDWDEFLNAFQMEPGSTATEYEPYPQTYLPENQ